jgi:hypothetical protein
MSVKGFAKKFRSYKLPCIILKNEAMTWVVGGQLQRDSNSLIDPWDLKGYEPRSDPTEIIGPAGFRKNLHAGIGYLCDEQGVTVSLKRDGPIVTEENSAENKEIVFGYLEGMEYRRNAEKVPFILVSNNGLTVTWGGEIRKRGLVLTDGPGQPVYRIKPDTPMIEILNIATGQMNMGYLCDEIGVTVKLKRDFRVTYPEDWDDPIKQAAIIEKNKKIVAGDEVGILIKFSGAIGGLMTFDVLPKIFDVGQSKRNLYTGIIVGAVVMFILRLMI